MRRIGGARWWRRRPRRLLQRKESHHDTTSTTNHREPWNKGKLVGQKAPLRPKDIWAIRVRLQMQHRIRELALFNLGFDSKLRGCGLVAPCGCETSAMGTA